MWGSAGHYHIILLPHYPIPSIIPFPHYPISLIIPLSHSLIIPFIMNILLLGSGGREHAFAWKLSRSKRCSRLYIAPGNAGTSAHGENVAIDPLDFLSVGQFCLDKNIDMLVVGPEEPLVRGIWDYFQENERLRSIPVIGPSKAGAVLEGSKAWSKQFMQRHKIPTAAYREFTGENLETGLEYLKKHALPIVLKADGLAAGKGVVICQSHREAERSSVRCWAANSARPATGWWWRNS